MVKLVIVGPSQHGKSTLLLDLKSKSRGMAQSITFFDRHASYSDSVLSNSS